MTPIETALAFVDAINRQHIDKLVGLMTPDHRFTDSLGKVIPGRRHMRDAWLGYFAIVPDYNIVVAETYADQSRVVVIGTASGTYSRDGELRLENRWVIPAAWRAVVDGDRVAEWNAFVDHEPLREAMRRAAAGSR
ncbi:MAG: nuclear transport factor 2 family protein [Deltaproteobacteria bacterium]|nr:nuclear transport factor 2 family protein [Deltaproteobacteria bacterium]